MTIIATPAAPHPQVNLREIEYDAGIIRFDWLNADNTPADSGGSLISFTPAGATLDDASIAATITAAAVS